jgi:hypothetical protein
MPSTSLSRWRSADTTALTLYTNGASDHPVLRTPRQNLTVRIFETVGWTAAPPSVHPVLKLQSWRVSVLIQTKRRIDRRCPHSDRRIVRCYYLLQLFSFQSFDASKKDRRFIRQCQLQFCLLRSVPSTPTLASRVPSVHLTMSFLFLSFLVFDPWKIDYLLNLACDIFLSFEPGNI